MHIKTKFERLSFMLDAANHLRQRCFDMGLMMESAHAGQIAEGIEAERLKLLEYNGPIVERKAK